MVDNNGTATDITSELIRLPLIVMGCLFMGCTYLPVGQTTEFGREVAWPDTVLVAEPFVNGYIENSQGDRDTGSDKVLSLKNQAGKQYLEAIQSTLSSKRIVVERYIPARREIPYHILWRATQVNESPQEISQTIPWDELKDVGGRSLLLSRLQVVRKTKILSKGGTDTRTTINFQYLLIVPQRREVIRYRATACPFCGNFSGGLAGGRTHRHVLKTLP
ncbi:MAG: hypothetical protein K1X47_08120 [Cyclobacteriaceae bacterium]|nr:hypothetical protein [Cyclobacteriaceae bacterium]